MKMFLIALSPEWESRLSQSLARRGHFPICLRRLEQDAAFLPTDEPVLAVFHGNGSEEEVLQCCRCLRERQPAAKLQILMCVSAAPDKESWPAYKRAGVNFFLPATFTDSELEFRLTVAEFASLSTSPTGTIATPSGRELNFSPDTENVPYGVFISTLDNRFLKVNDGLVNILGYSSKEELLQVDIARDIYTDIEERARLLASIPPHNKTLEVVWKRRDGRPVSLLLSGHYVLDESQHSIHLQGMAWDITEQKRSHELLRMQRDLGIALSHVSSLREMIDILLDKVVEIEGIDCAGFYLVEEGTRIYRLVANRGLSPAGAAAMAAATPDTTHIKMVEEGRPLYLRNEEYNAFVTDWLKSEDLLSSSCIPISHHGKVIATLNLGSRTQTEFPQAVRFALESIASQVGGSIARAQAEESLRTSRANLQTLFDAMSDLVIIVDRQGHIVDFNAATVAVLGYEAEELKGKHITKIHPAGLSDEVVENFRRFIRGKPESYYEFLFLTKSGKQLPMELRAARGTWAGQEVVYAVIRDLSEREASRKALAESEARFRAIFENASVGIGLSDTEGRIIDVNEALTQMESRSREEIIGHQYTEFTTPEDREVQQKLIHDIVEGRIESYSFEKRYLHKNGTPFWVRIHGSVVPPAPGEKPQYLVSIIENIDARKRAEQLLRESENRYRLITENVSDVVWSAHWTLPDLSSVLPAEGDPKTVVETLLRGWRFEYISPSLEKVLGYRADESISDTPITRMDPAWYPAVVKVLLDNLKELLPTQIFEFPMLTKEGAPRWCEVTVNILPTQPGEPLRMMGILRDISLRHEAQEALRKSEAQVRGLFANMPDFVLLLDQDATIRYVNHGTPEMAMESLIGMNGFSFIHESCQPQCQEAFAKALSTQETQNVEALAVSGNYWACRIVPMVRNEALDHVMIICTDITAEKKATQAVLEEQQLLRSLIDLQERERRYLSYEIHDGFAQQITGALFHLEAFKRLQESDLLSAEKNFDHAAAMIRRSIDETRRLISGLRPPILDESGILAAIDYLICEHHERSGIDIMFVHHLQAVHLAPPLECAVFRIVQESLTNACRHSRTDFVRVELNESGDRLQIVVFDEGVGFDPAAVADERFGLRSIRERARLLGGDATIASAPGEGCRISVELPLVPADSGV